MSEERPGRLADLPHLCRQWWQQLPDHWRAWREGLREDPSLFWRTPIVRIAAVLVGALVLYLAVTWLIHSLTPGGLDQTFIEPTQTATIYVACTNPDCRARATVQVPMDFDQWPMTCDKCGQATVYRAIRCDACRRWFATPPGSPPDCPFCAARDAAEQAVEKPKDRQPRSTDDDEDPW